MRQIIKCEYSYYGRMQFLINFLKSHSTHFITLLIGLFLLVVTFPLTSSYNEYRETKSVIEILQKTSEDAAAHSNSLKCMVERSNIKDLDSINSYKDFNRLSDFFNDFEYSGTNLPYPVKFDKTLDDEKVYNRLSSNGGRFFEYIQKSLKEEQRYILGLNKGTQDFLMANKDYPRYTFKTQDEAAKFLDLYVRIRNLDQYKKHLNILSATLKTQADYIEGDITDKEANDRIAKIAMEAFKPDSTPLEQENRLRDFKRVQEELRQLTMPEGSVVNLTQKPILK